MELKLRLVGVIQNFLCIILEPIYWFYTKFIAIVPLQPIKKEILTSSATQLAAKIRTGELKCEDVVHAFVFRSKRVNNKVNNIVADRYDDAMKEADLIDELVASNTKTLEELETEMPLLGVPISVSECCKVKGLSFSVGCKLREGKKAECDGEVVRLLRKAGAIPIAVTNQPELCLSTETNNLVTGLTRNPYNFHRTVGGAAGGEAVSVSGAGCAAGFGPDFLGSVRCPAMFTGIFGHRPTPNCVSNHGLYPGGDSEVLANHMVVGPLSRYSEDLPLLTRVIAAEHASKLRLDQQVNLKDLKVYYMTEIGFSIGLPSVDKEIKQAIKKAVGYLEYNCSCNVQKVNLSEMSDSPEMSAAVLFNIKNVPDLFKETDHENLKEGPDVFMEMLKSCIGQSVYSFLALQHQLMKQVNRAVTEIKKTEYIKKHDSLKKHIIELLGEDGVLILPTYPTAAHYHHQSLVRTLGASYCNIVTSLGLPATNIPMGLNRNKLPIGFQVVAAPYQDRLCFAVARELEKAFGGWVHPPSLRTLQG